MYSVIRMFSINITKFYAQIDLGAFITILGNHRNFPKFAYFNPIKHIAKSKQVKFHTCTICDRNNHTQICK